MIELIWNFISSTSTKLITNLLSWIVDEIDKFHQTTEKQDTTIKLRGFVVIEQDDHSFSILLISENNLYEKDLIKILQQPPGEFKEKYVARILYDEPIPVTERKNVSDDEEIDKNEFDDDDSDSEEKT